MQLRRFDQGEGEAFFALWKRFVPAQRIAADTLTLKVLHAASQPKLDQPAPTSNALAPYSYCPDNHFLTVQ